MYKKSAAVVGVFLLLIGLAAQAKDLYVDVASGNDNVSYSQNDANNPWASLGRAVWGSTDRSNPSSSQAAQAGDTVIVRAGTYSTDQGVGSRANPIYNPVNNGSAGNPITIRANGSVTLQSATSGPGEPIIGAFDRQHIVWDGFIIDEVNVHTAADTGPVVVWESDNITLQNLIVTGFNRGWADNHNAIRLEHTNNILIRNNILRGYREPQSGMNASIITAYYTAAAQIENNDLSDGNTGIFIKGLNTGPIIIRYNRISNVGNAIQFGGIGTSEGSNGAIAYSNVITDAWAGFAFIGYDNVSPANVTIANNTIVSVCCTDGGAILLRPDPAGYRNLRFYNNIIADSHNGISAWHNDLSDTTFAHNNYDSVMTVAYIGYSNLSFSNWQRDFGKDVVGSSVSPSRFVDADTGDYHLSTSSTLLNAGRDYLDLDGDGSTTDAISMGAFAIGNEIIGITDGLAEPPPVAKTPNPPTLQ